MSPAQMLADLPTACNVGSKRNAKGHTTSWIGYKPHVDTADGDIPVSCILRSAPPHDNQASPPLAAMRARCVTNLYVLMDKAYDAPRIWTYSRSPGQAPIIAKNPRRGGKEEARDIRFREGSAAERFNSNLKDQPEGQLRRRFRPRARIGESRGSEKVMCHLMFGVLALTIEPLMRLVA